MLNVYYMWFDAVSNKTLQCFWCLGSRCKKHNVPIEKIYNKTQRDKFRWAIDMAGPDYVF
jgi:hypothetical protein